MRERWFLGCTPLGFHRVAYTEWGAATQNPPVICVHGLTRNGRDFDRLAESLQNETVVFCPDIVGRGKSDWLSDAVHYNYAHYINDMTALIARTGSGAVDWVGTSMGGLIGLLMAAMPQTPIRRLVINDIGPLLPKAALKRISGYVGQQPEFNNVKDVEQYMRVIYASFGNLRDEDWRHLASHGYRALPNGQLTLKHDPAIAKNFLDVHEDANFWDLYDRIRCPVLVLRGATSDILSAEVAHDMTRRGPQAKLIEFPTGHAPALMVPEQIDPVKTFLRD